jgi:methyl-accepting chemotaxis protein
VEEQTAGGSQILNALKNVHDMTGQVRDGAGLIHNRSISIQDEMEKLQQISHEVSQSVHTMRIASGSIASFLENAKELARTEMVSQEEASAEEGYIK